jgi:hypothetical protein
MMCEQIWLFSDDGDIHFSGRVNADDGTDALHVRYESVKAAPKINI